MRVGMCVMFFSFRKKVQNIFWFWIHTLTSPKEDIVDPVLLFIIFNFLKVLLKVRPCAGLVCVYIFFSIDTLVPINY